MIVSASSRAIAILVQSPPKTSCNCSRCVSFLSPTKSIISIATWSVTAKVSTSACMNFTTLPDAASSLATLLDILLINISSFP